MLGKKDKKRLYLLIDQYLLGKINARAFCDEYYYCHDLELERDSLTDLEETTFSELGKVASRFSEFEEDLKKYPAVYFAEAQLKQKIKEMAEILKISTS